MNYFNHNAIEQGRARIRAAFLARPTRYRGNLHDFGALFASAHTTRERRLEGSRLYKRGLVNEMPFYLYGAKCRKAYCATPLRAARGFLTANQAG